MQCTSSPFNWQRFLCRAIDKTEHISHFVGWPMAKWRVTRKKGRVIQNREEKKKKPSERNSFILKWIGAQLAEIKLELKCYSLVLFRIVLSFRREFIISHSLISLEFNFKPMHLQPMAMENNPLPLRLWYASMRWCFFCCFIWFAFAERKCAPQLFDTLILKFSPSSKLETYFHFMSFV